QVYYVVDAKARTSIYFCWYITITVLPYFDQHYMTGHSPAKGKGPEEELGPAAPLEAATIPSATALDIIDATKLKETGSPDPALDTAAKDVVVEDKLEPPPPEAPDVTVTVVELLEVDAEDAMRSPSDRQIINKPETNQTEDAANRDKAMKSNLNTRVQSKN
uniref:Uncharacterized protein n=1 Tax=Amphimedon queenslandica TaxID=400682 RepID=A0A1X7US62_AMPQE